MNFTSNDRRRARELLVANVARAEPNAVAYIDWDAFEGVLDAVMASEAAQDPEAIMQVFKSSVAKARGLYHADRPPGPTN